ncbi:hypothetical protein BH11PLA2_BH11PLA2_00560 [soil metagenome]
MCRLSLIVVMLLGPLTWAYTAPIAVRTVSLKTLNATPDQLLGESVMFQAILPSGVSPRDGEIVLRIDAATKVTNLRFILTANLVAFAKELPASATERPVRVSGIVVAPHKQNGPYGIEVSEIQLLAADGSVARSSKATVAEIAVKAEAHKPKVLPAGSDAPAGETASDEVPKGTLIAAGVAILVGAGVALFLFLRSRKKNAVPPPPPPPATSVTDRLNRRVR